MPNAISISIDRSELIQWRNQVAMSTSEIEHLSARAVRKAGVVLYRRAYESAPERTGALKRSIYLNTTHDSVEVGSPLPRGFYQEFGTSHNAPHPWLFGNGDKAAEELEVLLADAAVDALIHSGVGLVGGLGILGMVAGAVFAATPDEV